MCRVSHQQNLWLFGKNSYENFFNFDTAESCCWDEKENFVCFWFWCSCGLIWNSSFEGFGGEINVSCMDESTSELRQDSGLTILTLKWILLIQEKLHARWNGSSKTRLLIMRWKFWKFTFLLFNYWQVWNLDSSIMLGTTTTTLNFHSNENFTYELENSHFSAFGTV